MEELLKKVYQQEENERGRKHYKARKIISIEMDQLIDRIDNLVSLYLPIYILQRMDFKCSRPRIPDHVGSGQMHQYESPSI